MTLARTGLILGSIVVTLTAAVSGWQNRAWPPPVQKVSNDSPTLTPDAELKTFHVPPGYRVELVASEPMVVDPIAVDYDLEGRLWVIEMLGFMPDTSGTDSREPLGRIAVLEDENDDGKMDKRTVFLDKLILPRAIKILDRGVLVAEPPNLWLARDTDGDLKADTKDLGPQRLRPARGQPRAQRQQPSLGARQHHLYLRAHVSPAAQSQGRKVRRHPDAQSRTVGCWIRRWRPDLSQLERAAALRRHRAGALFHAQPQHRPDAGAVRHHDGPEGHDGLAGAPDSRCEPRLSRRRAAARRHDHDLRVRRHPDDLSGAIDCRRTSTATRSSPSRPATSCTG